MTRLQEEVRALFEAKLKDLEARNAPPHLASPAIKANAAHSRIPAALLAAKKVCASFWDGERLQDRFDALLVAVGAKAMGRLQALHVRLTPERQAPLTHIGQLVPLFLSFPVAKVGDLVFKVAFRAGQRRNLRLCREQGGLDFKHLALQRELEALNFVGVPNTVEGLHQLLRRIQAAKTSCDNIQHHDRPHGVEGEASRAAGGESIA